MSAFFPARMLRLSSLVVLLSLAACDTAAPEPIAYANAEVKPVPVGGWEAFAAAVEYPMFASRAGIEGEVTVGFVVTERGVTAQPLVLASPNELLSEAALGRTREAAFEPGRQAGAQVDVRMAVCVAFRLDAPITAAACTP